jgi:hypothetical protein
MTLQLGLVGRGRWGRNIERTLLSFSDVSVTTVARGEGPPAGLDGIVIATPSATHAQTALPYIEAGIATFIEKPMQQRFPKPRVYRMPLSAPERLSSSDIYFCNIRRFSRRWICCRLSVQSAIYYVKG